MLNGAMLESFAMRGWNNIKSQEQYINSMNVFPVSDGDTGTNMRLTLENGLRFATGNDHLGQYAEALSRGMLLGARGNSGVIFSQLVRGLAESLKNKESAGVAELCEAFQNAYRVAYSVVNHPVEGTILTVAREAAEDLLQLPLENLSIENLMSHYTAAMNRSLIHTPDKLAVLREAGVLDSGAYGLTAFFKGFTEMVDSPELPFQSESGFTQSENHVQSEFNCGFCTEFIIRISRYVQEDVEAFKAYLDTCGDSLVFIRDGLDIKVHLHTDYPLEVISAAAQRGVFLNIKVDNLKEMCATAETKGTVSVKISGRSNVTLIATVPGDGFRELYQDMGCDCILEQSTSVSLSAADFLRAFESVPESRIAVFPNDRNLVLAANQAKQLYAHPEYITVLNTASAVEGYFVMSMADFSDQDGERLIHRMEGDVGCIETVTVTVASAERTINGVSCREGDYIALSDKQLLAAAPDRLQTAIEALLPAIDDAESVMIFYGCSVSYDEANALSEGLLEARPDLDIGVFDGGQENCDYFIGIVS